MLSAGELIRKKRKEKGLTLQNVADQLNVSKMTVSKWERGQILNIRREKLLALSQLLGVSPMSIINGADFDKLDQIDLKQFQIYLNYLINRTSGFNDTERNLIIEYVKLICKNKGE